MIKRTFLTCHGMRMLFSRGSVSKCCYCPFSVFLCLCLSTFSFCVTLSLKWGKKTRSSKPESPVQDQQDQAAIAEDEDKFVTMTQVCELLKVQEFMLKTLFESVVWSLSMRVDDVVKSVQSIKTSLEFTQKNMEELKPVQAELIKTNKEIERLNSDLSSQSLSLEYVENKSPRNNIMVNGILESSRETWEEAEEKVKNAVKTKLGIDIDIERAHRVERKKNRVSPQSLQRKTKWHSYQRGFIVGYS